MNGWDGFPRLARGRLASRGRSAYGYSFPDTKVKWHEIIGARGRVAVRASMSGTHLGDWFGVAATGKSFEMPIHEFHHIADGKLTHTWHLEDWLGWLSQVGAWPAGKQGTV